MTYPSLKFGGAVIHLLEAPELAAYDFGAIHGKYLPEAFGICCRELRIQVIPGGTIWRHIIDRWQIIIATVTSVVIVIVDLNARCPFASVVSSIAKGGVCFRNAGKHALLCLQSSFSDGNLLSDASQLLLMQPLRGVRIDFVFLLNN